MESGSLEENRTEQKDTHTLTALYGKYTTALMYKMHNVNGADFPLFCGGGGGGAQ